ncbi:MAG: hypothetical protein CVU78_01800 [Elusimicrobia bacterium HGW-Elusimicrobia-2]|nr:MAG: hypothetical protein CVU78_01800 [Elusimicrobia bacterium HGW-Elusimicrobia-2]
MSKKILVVDDDENIVELIRLNLEACGYYVITASDGKEGMEKAAKETPDLIFMDARMPGMDGFAACKNIKNNPGTAEIPVVFLTAATQKEDYENAKRAGCDHFLPKPFDPVELMGLTNSILNKPIKKKKIIIVDDDPNIVELLKLGLENAEKSCMAIIRDFDSRITELYNEEDLERGYILSKDRLGTEQKFPVMTLSIGAVIQDDYTNPVHYGNIVDTATQMKKFAKMNNPGSKSCYAFNKRK